MGTTFTRRDVLLGLTASASALAAAAQATIETHVHLFDPDRVPYAPDAPYRPAAYALEDHVRLVEAAGLAHSIIVHPEPYQDDHRYLEYCLAHEPRPGFFKATCLFDPFREDTPRRMRALAERWPKRIVALRIHEVSMTPEAGGPIRNRDMKDPRMLSCSKSNTEVPLFLSEWPSFRDVFRVVTFLHIGRFRCPRMASFLRRPRPVKQSRSQRPRHSLLPLSWAASAAETHSTSYVPRFYCTPMVTALLGRPR